MPSTRASSSFSATSVATSTHTASSTWSSTGRWQSQCCADSPLTLLTWKSSTAQKSSVHVPKLTSNHRKNVLTLFCGSDPVEQAGKRLAGVSSVTRPMRRGKEDGMARYSVSRGTNHYLINYFKKWFQYEIFCTMIIEDVEKTLLSKKCQDQFIKEHVLILPEFVISWKIKIMTG